MPALARLRRCANGTAIFAVLLGAGTRVADAQVTAADYQSRRSAVLARIDSGVMIVPARASFQDDDQMGLVQSQDFQYLTGLDDQVGAVLLLDGRDSSSTLFVPRRSLLVRRGIIPPTPASAATLGFRAVLPIDSLEPVLRRRFAATPSQVLVAGTDARGAVAAPLPMANTVLRWRSWLQALGARETRAAQSLLGGLRAIKSEAELAILRTVGRQSAAALLAGMRAVRAGHEQREAEHAVASACAAAGARSVSFWPWVLAGPNARMDALFSTFVSYDAMNRVMQPDEVVRVDIGCQSSHYMGDVGRTVPVTGRFTAGQRETWDLFIAGYRAGLPQIRDGATVRSVFDAVQAEVRRRQPALVTPEAQHAAVVILGPQGTEWWQLHGVGLGDAEELPLTLRTGMVLAYELMFTVDGDGFYLEDMLAVTREGSELLTPGLPYTAAEIEAAMRAPIARRGGGRTP